MWVPTEPGWCLAFVRTIVEQAFDMAPGEFYERWVDPFFALNQGERVGIDIGPRWARGAERALRAAGLAVHPSKMQPGDLLFSYKVSKPFGHTAILLDGKMVLENTGAHGGWQNPGMGAVRYTPLRMWDPVTTVVRLPEGGG